MQLMDSKEHTLITLIYKLKQKDSLINRQLRSLDRQSKLIDLLLEENKRLKLKRNKN